MSDPCENEELAGKGDGISGSQKDSVEIRGVLYLLGRGYVARRGVAGRRRRQGVAVGTGIVRVLARSRTSDMMGV